MRLANGSTAPSIATTDTWGGAVDLADLRGGPVLVSFYRYASCPLCNLRTRELALAYPGLASQGLRILSIFPSSPELIQAYVGRQQAPFPIIADPGRALYRAYGVESRWAALLSWRPVARALRAARQGFLPGKVDGDMHACPADFLVDADGRITQAWYGRHVDDHVPLARIAEWVAGGSWRGARVAA